jgi:zinc protease
MKTRQLFLLLLLGCACTLRAQLKETDPLPVDTAITVGKFANGFTYYIKKNLKPEKRVELRLVVKAGSVLEDNDQQGLAHFVEHMAFNGTKNFPKQELVDFVEKTGVRFGPHLNASTSFDQTEYMLQVPTDSEATVNKAFQIFEDWAHNVSFDDKEIDKERGVIVEEWRLGRGAQERIQNKHNPILFYHSRYAERLPIGKKEVIDTCSHESLRRFYKEWYRPDLMAFIVVGDIDKAEAEALIRQHFSQLKNPPNERPREEFKLPDHPQTLVSIATDAEMPVANVAVLFKRDEHKEKVLADYRKSIAGHLYDAMLNARLSELVQRPNPPFVYGYTGSENFIGGKDAYVLVAMVKENAILSGMEAIAAEAFRVQQHGFTETELDRAKRTSLRGMEQAYNEREKTESENYADEFERNFVDQEPIPGIAFEYQMYKQFIPEITLDEVNRLSAERIPPGNRVITVSAPKKEGVVLPDSMTLLTELDKVSKEKIAAYVDSASTKPLLASMPKPGKVVKETKYPKTGVTEWKLSNGARVVVKPTDFKNDEILFSASSFGGTSLVKNDDYVSASNAAGLVRLGGLDSFDAIMLQKMLAGKIASVSPYFNELQEGLSGSMAPRDAETFFQLLYLTFTAPRKDTSAFTAYVSRVRASIASRSANPDAAFADTIATVTSGYNYRSRPVSEALIDEMNLDKAFAFYKDRFADASDFTFFFVGSFELKQMKTWVEQYVASLPSINRKETWKDVGIRFPKGTTEREVDRGIEPKSTVKLMYAGPFEWSTQNRFDLQMLVEVMRIKLREQMREEKGGVYGVSVSGATWKFPVSQYQISIAWGCAPERVNELIGVVNQQIDSLKKYPVKPDYLTKVKETQIREREVNLKENNFWLGALGSIYYYGMNPEQILDRIKLINALKDTDIQHAAQTYFTNASTAKFVLNPEKK